MSRSTTYVPTLGDHWLRTEWSSVRRRLPTIHGTKREAIKSLHDRVKFLVGRGWRVTSQKMLDDRPGERRMLVRITPPAEYAHCGDSTIEYRSCGGSSWCKLCTEAEAYQERIETIREQYGAGVERAQQQIEAIKSARSDIVCNRPEYERGICRTCGRPLYDHLPAYTRMAVDAFWGK
jgi:hypothetical protein